MSFALPLRSLGRSGASHFPRPGLGLELGTKRLFHQPGFVAAAAASASRFQGTASHASSKAFGWAGPLALLAGVGLSSLSKDAFRLEESIGTSAPFSSTSSETGIPYQADMPKSDVNVYNLGFGTACGICSGIFIKKGAKFIAFLLGGGFVLLQYLNTQRIISINWRALTTRYDSAISKAAGEDSVTVNKPTSGWNESTAAKIWNRSIHFLTADFPSRGTFVAGLLLGLRLG